MPTILIAEDEAHILLLIQRLLATAGHTTLTAANGPDALRLALENKPDLVILDVMLPEVDGLKICKEIKTTFGTDAPPVILISALGQHMDVEAGMQAGADDYVIKPFSPRALVERVEKALRR